MEIYLRYGKSSSEQTISSKNFAGWQASMFKQTKFSYEFSHMSLG